MFLVQVNDREGVLKEITHVGTDRAAAEQQFIATCAANLTNFEDYDTSDVAELLTQGYETFGGGTIQLIDTDGFTSDDDIRNQLTKQPSGDMTVAEIIESGEVALVEGMTVDQMLELCGRGLDAANSWDIQGQVLFKGSDGKWYTITTESIVAEAAPQFVTDTLAENKDE